MKFLLTAFCKDRPGIVADISKVIYENGFNLEDSSMTYLADGFATLLLLSIQTKSNEQEILEMLSAECRRLEQEKGITVYVRKVADDNNKQSDNGPVHYITVEGLDQTGIVFKISSYLASKNVNIRILRSKTRHSPHSGASLYSMHIEVSIPDILPVSQVEEDLNSLSEELNVEITLSNK